MKFLLAISIGPVQDFIAAARRTRDLWFGSYLLSEVSKAAAKAVQDKQGKLIFPALTQAADSELNVANVIVAEIEKETSECIAEIAASAKQAAQKQWRSFADEVFRKNQACIQKNIWNDQVDDVLECFAAWIPLSDPYQESRKKLMRLLSARKACRDFLPARGRAGVPKSSLDGLRESVLQCPNNESSQNVRLNKGEQLDVVGMVKRCWNPSATENQPTVAYPSVARIAADPWLRDVGEEHLKKLKAGCEKIFPRVNTSENRGYPKYSAFPFEGTAVYPSRYTDIQQETNAEPSDLESCKKALQKLIQNFGEASPYFAILVADGDKMGAAIASMNTPEEHREFSLALATFAKAAHDIVQRHYGVLIYAGGDDVLAFVPLDKSISCSRSLYDDFAKRMQSWSSKKNPISLSVGLAITHFMEPLEDILAYGRAAEKHAKTPRPEDGRQQERNGFAIHLIKRGGSPIAIRSNWSEEPNQHFANLNTMLQEKTISGRFAYDLRELSRLYESWPQETVAEAIQKDVIRVLQKKSPVNKEKSVDLAKLVQKEITDAESLKRFSCSLLIARQIAEARHPAENSGNQEEKR